MYVPVVTNQLQVGSDEVAYLNSNAIVPPFTVKIEYILGTDTYCMSTVCIAIGNSFLCSE